MRKFHTSLPNKCRFLKKKFLCSRGATLIEYLVLIVVLSMVVVLTIQNVMNDMTEDIADKVDDIEIAGK